MIVKEPWRAFVVLLAVTGIVTISGCSTMGGNHEFNKIQLGEIPIMKTLASGPITRRDVNLHEKIWQRCTLVVKDMRGTPAEASARRSSVSAVAGGGGAVLGGALYNTVSGGSAMLLEPLAAMYAAVTGVTMAPSWGISYRDENMNLVFSCVRDGEIGNGTGSRVVWYSHKELRRLLKNPEKKRAFDAAFKKGMSAMRTGGKPYWPPYKQSSNSSSAKEKK